LAQLKQLK